VGPGARLIPKLLVQIVLSMAVYGALLFGGAGTFDWPSAWAYVALLGGASLVVSLWLAWVDPELLEERMKPPIQKAQKSWDKLFFLGLGVFFLAWIALQGLDARRFRWSHLPLWAQALGGAMTLLSFLGIAWVYRTNSFAAPVIKMQAERRQTVISTGPYAYVRHPMYAFGSFTFLGMPLMVGSAWGLAALPVIAVGLHLRTLGEEKMLRAELAGYEAYAQRVRWRYAPGIW
jgi:protein-S-isoprenylcysteine O-methyltransferase Ste14